MFGIPVEQWITAMTFIYLLLAIGLLIPKYSKLAREWLAARRTGRKGSDDEPKA